MNTISHVSTARLFDPAAARPGTRTGTQGRKVSADEVAVFASVRQAWNIGGTEINLRGTCQ
jgi:hypothetical protein